MYTAYRPIAICNQLGQQAPRANGTTQLSELGLLGLDDVGTGVVARGEAAGNRMSPETIQAVQVSDPQNVHGPIDGICGVFSHKGGQTGMIESQTGAQEVLIK